MADIQIKIKAKAYTKTIGLTESTLQQLDAEPQHVAAGKKYFSKNNVIEEGAMAAVEGQTITPSDNETVIAGNRFLNSDIVVEPVPTETREFTATDESTQHEATTGKYINQLTINPTPLEDREATAGTEPITITRNSGVHINQVVINPTPLEDREITASTDPVTLNRNTGVHINQVIVNPTPSEEKTATPVEEIQEITPSEGKLLSKVVVEAIDSNYVGSGVYRQGAVTFIPSTTDLTIAADTYLTGDVTIKGEPNLLAENIKKGVVLYEGTAGAITGTMSAASGDDMLQQMVNAQGSCDYLFYEYYGDNVDYIVNLDTSNVTSMRYMFYGCDYITSGVLLDTSNVKSMNYMFSGCKYLTYLPQYDTSNVENMENMFNGCVKLTSEALDAASLNTSNVKNMSYMFSGCNLLTYLPQYDTSNVTNMRGMLQSCSALTTLPLLNTSNVNNMLNMLYGCSKLTTVPALDVSNVTNMNNMFSGCSALKSILMTGMKVSFNISASTQFEQSDLVTILNNLATITSTQTLTMGSTNLAKLTDADKAIATNKGWTLA